MDSQTQDRILDSVTITDMDVGLFPLDIFPGVELLHLTVVLFLI